MSSARRPSVELVLHSPRPLCSDAPRARALRVARVHAMTIRLLVSTQTVCRVLGKIAGIWVLAGGCSHDASDGSAATGAAPPSNGGANGGAHSVLPWDQNQIKRALALGFPGWLSAAEDFSYAPSGIDEHAEIMAKRTA